MWTLLLARASDPPGTFIDRRTIDSGQIKMGRNARSCDWVLPDDKGVISREHCTISAVGLDLYVIDTSTNGVALNRPDGRIAPQLPVAIRANDKLLIGDFVLTVTTEAMAAGIALAPPPPPALPSIAPSSGQDDIWFAPPADPIWNNNPRDAEVHEFLGNAMDDFLGFSAKAPAPPMEADPFARPGGLGEAFARPILADMPPAGGDMGIPEDWAALSSSPAAAPPPADPFARPAAPAADPFGTPPPRPSPAHDPFGAPPPPFGGSDPFADFPPLTPAEPARPSSDPFGGPVPLPAASSPLGSDPFASPSPPAPAFPNDDPFALPAGQYTPADIDPFADPLPTPAVAPVPAPPPPASMPKPVASPAAVPSADGGWAAFLEGAGLTPDDIQLAPDAMHRLGVLYRQVVLGLSDIIQDRAAFKDEFRVERTQLSIGRNNPLKHLPPLDSAKVMLGAPLPGFMSSEDAVRSAFEDIKKHQLAMLAGVQHALTAVFDRLSPAEIEKLMEKAAGAKRGLAFGRGINPWTVYQTIFEALRRDAVSNANGVMSVAFREGYEKFLKSGQ